MAASLLPDVAAKVAELFPELGGRSLAVSEAAITKENLPTLPLCMVALVNVMPEVKWLWQAGSGRRQLIDDFVVELWLPSVKYRREDNTETPFWAFYDYEPFLDKMLDFAEQYVGPGKQRLEFLSMGIDSDQFAVVLSFRYKAHYTWCAPDPVVDACEPSTSRDGNPARIISTLCRPKSEYCGPAFEEKEEEPCP